MRNKIYFALSLLGLLFACTKPEPEPQKPEIKGRLNALKNGEAWEAYAHGRTNNFNTAKLLLFFTAEENNLDIECTVRNIPRVTGKYYPISNENIKPSNDSVINASCYISDYDLLLADYDLMEDSTNVVTIDTYDAVADKYSGTLNLIFVVNRKNDDLGLPDTIRIKNGVFFGEVLR
ncbi:MAG: hypothetical protein J0L99_05500 [Chitinophagales bacterium]|nr:hypothetical protein [Chitinophagales bacterium]